VGLHVDTAASLVDLPVRGARDGARERLHAGAHVARPLPGRRPSHHVDDDTQRAQHVGRTVGRLGRHRRR